MTSVELTWIDELAPHPLPRRVSPVHGETVDHFIGRLARANHLSTVTLLGHLCTPHGPSLLSIRPQRLAAATGQPVELITQRLPGLAWAHRSSRSNPYIRPACRRCMARRGLLDPVPCHIPAHVCVCHRHQLWIGFGARSHAQQHDLSAFPEMRRAQRRHHRLRRRHDPHDVVLARHHAERGVAERASRGEWSTQQQRRLTGLAPEIWQRVAPDAQPAGRRSCLHHVAVTIATYPEVIDHMQVLLAHGDRALLLGHSTSSPNSTDPPARSLPSRSHRR